MYNVTKDLHFK